jgi:two-component system cell cycle sensor histidine kinase/response regulator CckA
MKILIVDDNEENRYMLETLLKGEGHEVLSARDGLEALDLLRSSGAAMIIADILMPKMDGFELCRAVRGDKDLKDIPFVIYTATYVSDKDREFALSLGADRFLVKPDDMEQLGQTIKEVFAKNATPFERPIGDEKESFRQYNEVLFRKLEKKVSDLEVARRELQKQLLERQRIEEALNASLQQMGAILNNIPDMAWLKDMEGRFIAVNAPLAEACQGKPQDIVGKTDLDIWPEDLARLYRMDDAEVIRTKQRKRVEERFAGSDGTESWIETIKTPVFDLEGNVIGTTGIARDITERRRIEAEKALLEEQLQQAQKMEAIGQLAGGVAHDFNNILSAIVGYSTLATMNMKAEDPNRQNIEQILASADRATTLTQSLLAFSRKQAVNLERIDLNETVSSFKGFLLRLLPENIELKLIIPPGELPMTADRGQIEQVLMNLITNARDAIRQDGRIIIETGRAELDESFVRIHGFGEVGHYALLAVTDTGAGIPEDVKDKIFDPFFTTKEHGKGTGLGLSMVFGIVKRHKGYINVYSQQGSGTTFKIYLPVTHAPAQQAEEKADEIIPVQGGIETVLVAEDDDALRGMAVAALSHYGYTVIEAVDGIEAVTRFAKNRDRIRLVILDGIMPKKSGKEASEEIRALSPDIKVIFVSGYPHEMLSGTGISQKGEAFIQKPFSPSELARRIRKMLDE